MSFLSNIYEKKTFISYKRNPLLKFTLANIEEKKKKKKRWVPLKFQFKEELANSRLSFPPARPSHSDQ